MFCLPAKIAEKLKQAFKEGKVNPERLNDLTSAQRRDFLTEIIGKENAQQVNLLFEQKLLLKNQERAMYDWANEITGLSKEAKEATLTKIRETYAEKKRRLEDPAENEKFLNEITSDVYSRKYKTEVTLEEAQNITELAQDLKRAKEKMKEDFTWENKKDGLEYGATKVAFDNYTGGLKLEATKVGLPEIIGKFKEKGMMPKVGATADLGKMSFNFIAENSRAIVASVDNSFWGRQGIKVLFNPKYSKSWAQNFAKSFIDIYQTLKGGTKAGDAIVDATKAEIYSRKNYLNGRYAQGKKLDVGIREEEFPTSLPSKIPVVGRVFKAAETAYEAGAMRLRADIADRLYALAEKNGIDLTNPIETGSINQLTNSMTGRGSLGRVETIAPIVNKAFFSIKFFKSNLDTLTLHAGTEFSPFARKQAAQNLLMNIATIGTILTIANTLDPDSVNSDSRSANFGKIKIGDSRFDMTGGAGSIIILASRIATQSTKSSITGKVTNLGEGYGAADGMDVFWNFTENKFSPMFSVIKEIVQQETFEGDKPTLLNEAKNLTVPIIFQEGASAIQNEKSANLLLILIADGLGISVGTYSIKSNWGQSTSKEMAQFKEKVGDKKFKEANDKFNKDMSDWFDGVQNTETYKNLSDDDKGGIITNKRTEIKKKVFREYGFKYKSEPATKLPKL